jgi:hypothetical protein
LLLREFRRKSIAIVKLFGLVIVVGGVGLFVWHLGISALLTGELEIPRKYSSTPKVIVTPQHAAGFYYGFLVLYLFFGAGAFLGAVGLTWRFLRGTPETREEMLALQTRLPKDQSRIILRSIIIFVFVPLVAICLIMVFTILKS